MRDEQLWAIAAYLKNGLKPVSNKGRDSEGPPDFWASTYTVARFGPYRHPPFQLLPRKEGSRSDLVG